MEQNILEDRDMIKKIFKEAISEYFEEKEYLLRNEILEVVDDIAMLNAITEGEETDLIDEKEVLKTLGINHDN